MYTKTFILSLSILLLSYLAYRSDDDSVGNLLLTEQLTAPQDLDTSTYLSPPLIILDDSPLGYLSTDGIFQSTNAARLEREKIRLSYSPALALAAQEKVKDIFIQGYFDHVSPQGVTPGDLVRRSGYDFISVGENLALGNFQDDEQVVNAWLNSPPHRKALLATNFIEIGIAVGQGEFNKRQVWVAVQLFAVNAAACVKPDPTLRLELEEIMQLRAELDAAFVGPQGLTEEMKILRETLAAELELVRAELSQQGHTYQSCFESYVVDSG